MQYVTFCLGSFATAPHFFGWVGSVYCCHGFFSKRALSFPGSCELLVVGSFFALCCKFIIYILYIYYINILYEWYILCMHGLMYGLVSWALPTKTQIFPFFLWWSAPSLRRVVSANVGPRSHEKRRSLDAWLELGIAHYSGDKDGRKPLTVYIPMVFIVFSRDSWGLQPINTHYIGLI